MHLREWNHRQKRRRTTIGQKLRRSRSEQLGLLRMYRHAETENRACWRRAEIKPEGRIFCSRHEENKLSRHE